MFFQVKEVDFLRNSICSGTSSMPNFVLSLTVLFWFSRGYFIFLLDSIVQMGRRIVCECYSIAWVILQTNEKWQQEHGLDNQSFFICSRW